MDGARISMIGFPLWGAVAEGWDSRIHDVFHAIFHVIFHPLLRREFTLSFAPGFTISPGPNFLGPGFTFSVRALSSIPE